MCLNTNESLATLAHELREPLATITLALEAIPPHTDPAAQRAQAIATHQARRAVRMIDDLFDLCNGSWDGLLLNKELLDLDAVVARSTETTAHLFAARRHRLTISLPDEPVSFVGDPMRLEQVLTNLLANAAKFTDPGGNIHLSAESEAGQVVLRVRDNGRGIPRDVLPRVFDPFWRHLGTGTTCARGLGIGLALVKTLVESHGGSVTAWSDGPGAGTEFTICLPTYSCEIDPAIISASRCTPTTLSQATPAEARPVYVGQTSTEVVTLEHQ